MNNEFDLQRAIAGEPIEKEVGTTVSFIAYIPTAKADKQLIVQDGDNILAYCANGRYITPFISSPFDLRMKSELKQIDWTKLPVDTLVTVVGTCLGKGERMVRCYSSFSQDMVRCYRGGATSKTVDRDLEVFEVKPSDIQIAPDQPWTVWVGGACPIPDGLEFEYMVHAYPGKVIVAEKSPSEHCWSLRTIYAYRLTGKALDGWTL
jgi:hypothetical protein